jgi:RAB protein geranylgeranyltransferase component A
MTITILTSNYFIFYHVRRFFHEKFGEQTEKEHLSRKKNQLIILFDKRQTHRFLFIRNWHRKSIKKQKTKYGLQSSGKNY